MNGPIKWFDFNNDGTLDLLVGGEAANDGISPDPTALTKIYNGLNFNAEVGGDLLPTNYGSAAVGDFDHDCDLDLALVGGNAEMSVYAGKIYRNNQTYSLRGKIISHGCNAQRECHCSYKVFHQPPAVVICKVITPSAAYPLVNITGSMRVKLIASLSQ